MNLRELMAKASPARSGDELAGIAAATAEERGARADGAGRHAARSASSPSPLIPYETDEVTRLICDSHDAAAFAPVAHLTVGEFRDWLLVGRGDRRTSGGARARASRRRWPRPCRRSCGMQDLVSAAAKCRVVTRFRSTIGLAGPPLHAPPAEPSHRRSQGHRGERPRRSARTATATR